MVFHRLPGTITFSRRLRVVVLFRLLSFSRGEVQWVLSSRSVENSKFKEFRLIGKVNASQMQTFQAAQKLIFEDENLPKEMKQSIIEKTENEIITYYQIKMPFFIMDRDLVVKYVLQSNSENTSYGIIWKETPQLGPPPPKRVIRMPSVRGKWTFTPLNEFSISATFIQFSDIGGSMPAWLVNKMSGASLVEDLEKLRVLVSKKDPAK